MRKFESFLKNVSSNVDNKTKHDKLFQRLFISCLIFSSVVLSSIIPPVQSPDEIQHLYRAYSFAHGSITGVTVNNVTGDYIDTGLIKFIKSFEVLPFHPEKKLTKNDIELAKTISLLWIC